MDHIIAPVKSHYVLWHTEAHWHQKPKNVESENIKLDVHLREHVGVYWSACFQLNAPTDVLKQSGFSYHVCSPRAKCCELDVYKKSLQKKETFVFDCLFVLHARLISEVIIKFECIFNTAEIRTKYKECAPLTFVVGCFCTFLCLSALFAF